MACTMSTRDPSTPPRTKPWLIKRADQAAVAGMALVALVVLALYWWLHGGWSSARPGRRLIEIDHEPPRKIDYRVDINTATWPELAQLPGLGEGLARRIVASRERDGAFTDHEALRRVPGIGGKTLERIRPYLRPIASRLAQETSAPHGRPKSGGEGQQRHAPRRMEAIRMRD